MIDRDELRDDIVARDANDMNRKVGPLKQAKDAIYLDCSKLTIEKTSDQIIKHAKLDNE